MMNDLFLSRKELIKENSDLRNRLSESGDTLRAIRNGEVDAFVITKTEQAQTYSLSGSDYPYRAMVENMNEGAVTLTSDGTIFYCNPYFSEMIGKTSEELIGTSFKDLVIQDDQGKFLAVLNSSNQEDKKGEFYLQTATTRSIPGLLSIYRMEFKDSPGVSIILSDLTEQKHIEQELQGHIRELALLDQASKVITSSLDIDQILKSVLAEMYQQMHLAGRFWLTDSESEELICRHAVDPSGRVTQDWKLHPYQNIAKWVVEHNESLIIPNATHSSSDFSGIGEDCYSILSVPLQMNGKVFGVLQAIDVREGHFTESELTIVESLAAAAAVAAENARLYQTLQQELIIRKQTEQDLQELSTTDALTGLNNRRGFFLLANHHLRIMRREEKSIVLIFGDLDEFKSINDNFGHQIGDVALVQFAEIMQKSFRESDILARIGGDEFVVLATINKSNHYQRMISRWNKNISNFNNLGHYPFKLSVSIGVISQFSNQPISIEEMLNQADFSMYRNKKRNSDLTAWR